MYNKSERGDIIMSQFLMCSITRDNLGPYTKKVLVTPVVFFFAKAVSCFLWRYALLILECLGKPLNNWERVLFVLATGVWRQNFLLAALNGYMTTEVPQGFVKRLCTFYTMHILPWLPRRPVHHSLYSFSQRIQQEIFQNTERRTLMQCQQNDKQSHPRSIGLKRLVKKTVIKFIALLSLSLTLICCTGHRLAYRLFHSIGLCAINRHYHGPLDLLHLIHCWGIDLLKLFFLLHLVEQTSWHDFLNGKATPYYRPMRRPEQWTIVLSVCSLQIQYVALKIHSWQVSVDLKMNHQLKWSMLPLVYTRPWPAMFIGSSSQNRWQIFPGMVS